MKRPASLTEGSIGPALLRFAVPILAGNVLQSLNGSINSIWVGRFLGEAALTATSNANMVIFLLLGAGAGIAMAATILVAQRIGADNLPAAKQVIGTGTTFFAAISVLIAITGLVVCRPLLHAMKTPPESMDLAVTYLRVIFLALPFLYGYAFVMSILRGSGDSTTPFRFMVLSVAIDIVLNPVLIFGLGPLPRLGIAGSACATLVAQALSLAALLIHLYRRKHALCLHRGERGLLRIDWALARTLLLKGIPMGSQLLIFSLSGVLMISLVNRFGVDLAAAFGAALQLWNYLQMPAVAVSMAVTSMAAQNVGAGHWDRVRTIACVGSLYGTALTGAIALVLELLDVRAFGLFLPAGAKALGLVTHLNRIATGSWVIFSVTLVLFGVIRATGTVLMPLLITAVSLLGARYALAASFLDRYHADAIWWSFPVSSALSSMLALLYYRYGDWRSTQRSARREVPQGQDRASPMVGTQRQAGRPPQ